MLTLIFENRIRQFGGVSLDDPNWTVKRSNLDGRLSEALFVKSLLDEKE